MFRLIRMFSIIGDTVLDPFLGTGTTTKVAIELHRNSIGYEIDENLLSLIKNRIRTTGVRIKDEDIVLRDDRKKALNLNRFL